VQKYSEKYFRGSTEHVKNKQTLPHLDKTCSNTIGAAKERDFENITTNIIGSFVVVYTEKKNPFIQKFIT